MNTISRHAILGVSGKMGSGKSTVARLAAARLMSATGVQWKVVAFADALKALVCKMYDVPLCLAYTDVGKKTVPYHVFKAEQEDLPIPISEDDLRLFNGILQLELPHEPTLAQLFQTFGELFRSFDPDYWVKAFALQGYTNIVIEDVRYPNEVDWIHSQGGVVCRVLGGGGTEAFAAGRNSFHPSEVSLADDGPGWDFAVDNSVRGEDLSGLHRNLARMLDAVML